MSKNLHLSHKLLLFLLPLVSLVVLSCHNILAPVVTVAINDAVGAPGDTVMVPIHTSKVTGLNILSCDISVSFNTDILNALKVTPGTVVPANWSVESHSSSQLAITMDGTEPLEGNGVLVNLYFIVTDKASVGDTCTLQLGRCDFNECRVLSALNNGLFTVVAVSAATVWIPDSLGEPGDTVVIPINVDNATELDIVACDITLSFDGNILTALEASLGSLPSGWLLESHPTPGQIVIAMAGTTPLGDSGSLVTIPFVVSQTASSGDTTTIHFVSCLFNEGAVQSDPHDGLFTVSTEHFSISGYVREADETPIVDVTMILSGDASDTIYSDGSGYYEFTGLLSGDYTITPSKPDWIFDPGHRDYTALDSDQTNQNYTGSPIYDISGQVVDTVGTPIDSVMMVLSGSSDTVYTDGSGYYEFTGLVSGHYTVTPSKSGWTFDPEYREYFALSANQTDQNYVGASIPTATLSIPDTCGTPRDTVIVPIEIDDVTGFGLISCDITITFDPSILAALPASVGDIVPVDWLINSFSTPGQIVIAMAGTTPISGSGSLVLIPLVVSESASSGDTSAIHFASCSLNEGNIFSDTHDGLLIVTVYSISGYVKQSDDTPIDSVAMILSGDVSDTVYTSNSGLYEFVDLSSGNYTVTPSKFAWAFEPVYRDYMQLGENQTDQNYVGTPIPVVRLWIPDTSSTPGDTVCIPINIGDVTDCGIVSCDITITFDAGILATLDATLGDIVPVDWLIQSHSIPGQIVVALSGSTPLSDSGSLVTIPFVVSETSTIGNTSALHFADHLLNEGSVPSSAEDGLFRVVGLPVNVWIPDTSGSPPDTIAVPINVGDVTGRDIVACNITITFDPDILTALSATSGDAVPLGWSINSYLSAGQITIEMSGITPLSESGSIVMIPFVISKTAAEDDTSTMHFASCLFNGGDVPSIKDDGLFAISHVYYSISGYVTEEDFTPIENVVMVLSGNASDTVYTDGSGYYEFDKLLRGVYTVTPSKIGWWFKPDDIIYCPLNSDQINQNYTGMLITYDIKGEVRDTLGDPLQNVILILTGAASDTEYTDLMGRYEFLDLLYGDYTVTPQLCGWLFDPEYRNYEPLNTNYIYQDYTGVPIAPVDVWLPETTKCAPGDTVDIPIYIEDVTNLDVTEVEIDLTFNKNKLAALNAYSGDIVPGDWQLESYPIAGEIGIEMTGTTPLSEGGILAFVPFVVDTSAIPCQLVNVHFQKCKFNDGCVPTNPTDGGVKIIPGPQ